MDLNDAYTFLNFYIDKAMGSWYSPEELDMIVEMGQQTLFNQYYVQFATSQRLDDALAPFKVDQEFSTMVDGIITKPANYLDLLSIYTLVQGADSVTRPRAVEVVSEKELAIRLNSQVCPVSVNDPIALIQSDQLQLYPAMVHAGHMLYLRRPAAPNYVYTLVSGRVIVYNQMASTQLEWSNKDVNAILIIALNSIGINMNEADILNWSETKSQQNINTNMKQ